MMTKYLYSLTIKQQRHEMIKSSFYTVVPVI